jgi:hypothetical protein
MPEILSLLKSFPKVASLLLKWRSVAKIRAIANEERAVYMDLLARNNALWGQLQDLHRRNPDSDILKFPLSKHGRPLVKMEASEQDREEMSTQSAQWRYLQDLSDTLREYKWPAKVTSEFVLTIWRENRLDSTIDLALEYMKRQDELLQELNRKAQRWIGSVSRRVRIVEAVRKENEGAGSPSLPPATLGPDDTVYGSPYRRR